jgi:hypothetical protein
MSFWTARGRGVGLSKMVRTVEAARKIPGVPSTRAIWRCLDPAFADAISHTSR